MDGAGIEGIDEVVGELLAIPPEDFTERRNARAKELRAEGRRDLADAVKALPRPPLALWALNRLAGEQPALLDAFLTAAAELRDAFRDGGDVRAATKPERDAEAKVIGAAAEVVRAHGKAATDTVLRGLGEIVHAAAANADVGEALRQGRLIREPAAPSIDDLLGSLPAAPPPPKAEAKKAAPASRDDHESERRELSEQVAAAEADAKRAHERERAAAKAAREARTAAEAAERAAAQAEQSREDADERLAALRDQLERP